MKILAGPDNWAYFTGNFRLGLSEADSRFFKFEKGKSHREIRLDWSHSMSDLLARLPEGWEPDWVVWWMPEYQPILPGIEDCPYPTLLVISDWNVASEPLCRMVEAFDVVATDAMGVQRLTEFGVEVPVFEAPIYGFNPGLHRLLPEIARDIPVGYIGNTNNLVYQERMRTLATACLGLERGQVVVASGVYDEDYVKLLNRFQITLNHSLRGELNMRSFEAMACGSLLFCEDTNVEAPKHFKDGEHLVLFNEDNLLDRLRYYLSRPDELKEIARQGYERVQEFSYQKQWGRLMEQATGKLTESRRRPFSDLTQEEKDRRRADHSYQVFSFYGLASAIPRAEKLADQYRDDYFLNNLGCLCAIQSELSGFGEREKLAEKAVDCLTRVKGLGILPRLSLARLLVGLGRIEEAIEVLKECLAGDLPFQQVAFYPRLMHPMALLWERETDPESRQQLAMWQVYDLLSALDTENSVEHARKALTYRHDLPTTWVRLSQLEGLTVEERVEALSECIKTSPFWLEARALRLETATVRHPDFAAWSNELGLLLASCYPINTLLENRLTRAHAPTVLRPESLSFSDFVNGVSFKLCPPELGLDNVFLWEPVKCLEVINTVFPIDDKAIKAKLAPISHVPRMSTLAVAAVINRAVESMPEGLAYLNVGVWNGYSFLAGMIGNPERRCIGVDNFSQFGGPAEAFKARFESFKGPAHSFFDMDYEEYLEKVHTERLGLYFYDGEHSYINQYRGLQLAEKFFAPGCLVLVDDTNWDDPRQATFDFVEESKNRYTLVMDARTPYSGHPTWWNGLMIFRFLGS